MKRPRRRAIDLDFARTRARPNGRGIVLLVVGLAAATFVFTDYLSVADENEGVELRLASMRGDAKSAKPDSATVRAQQDADAALRELATPWSTLLRELELATSDAKGSVATLGIEPDATKGEVRILAEARTLPIALAYVERLQKSEALKYPMLESHELQQKDPERPVRFQIKAGWRMAP